MKPEESVTRAESGLVFMYRGVATGSVCTGLSGHADLKASRRRALLKPVPRGAFVPDEPPVTIPGQTLCAVEPDDLGG